MKNSVFIAASLDGYIARENGAIDWLELAPKPFLEDFGYQEFFNSIDVVVMGSGTFRSVLGFEDWPYNDKKVIVLSRTLKTGGRFADKNIEFSSTGPMELTTRLAAGGCLHAYIDGGQVIQSYLREDLIDEIILTRIPVLIGSGRALFGPTLRDMPFRHQETRAFSNGFVQSRYVRP